MVKKFWQNFKTQPDVWFFYGFLLTFTLSIRKVLFFYPINNQFNEYSGIYLYLSDIFLMLALLTWGYSILYNNKYRLSNITTRLRIHFKTVPCGTILLLPLFLVIWSGISLLWAENKLLAVFRSLKLAELYLLYLYVIHNVPRLPRRMFHVEHFYRGGTLLRNIFRIIIGLGIFQSVIAIWQFLIQHSVGLTWLRESLVNSDILGVAKIILDDHKIVRAYGLFPHPNILGGFLLISIILTWAYSKLFHPSRNEIVSRETISSYGASVEQGDAPHNVSRLPRQMFHMEHFDRGGTFTKHSDKAWLSHVKTSGILYIQILALIATFSKSAILALLIAAGYVIYTNVPRLPACRQVERHRLHRLKQLFHVEQFSRRMLLVVGIILMLLVISKPDINSLLFKSLNERLFYLNVSRGTIMTHPVVGVGAGQSVLEMNKFVPRPPRVDERSPRVEAGGTNVEFWQYQPVHNVFLLIWAELGIAGLGLFLWFLWELFHMEQKISQADIKCSTPAYRQVGGINDQCEVYEPIKPTNVPRGTLVTPQEGLKILKGAIVGLIFIMLFDHYLWDIQQGEIMLWLMAGLLAGIGNSSSIDKC